MQHYAATLIDSIIETLYNGTLSYPDEPEEPRLIGNETASRCIRILNDLSRYHISSPDTVVNLKEKVETIVDMYVTLMLKDYWATNERHWFSVAAKFLELSADVVAHENQLTATSVLNRATVTPDVLDPDISDDTLEDTQIVESTSSLTESLGNAEN